MNDDRSPGAWTTEQLENAAKYGVCLVCGFPRDVKVEGRPMIDTGASLVIVCPNGHPQ